ncbi:peptidyl-tRNA hydrolase [Candidatus Woesearchaeota archaeon]|nr:peptidyl-tRNA hydrolase [Candidatus Woesearchaeota archaeon]
MKQVILVRMDLKLPKGKLASQCAHAAVECVLRSDKDKVSKWRKEGMAKIVVKVNDLKELQKYNQLAKDSGLTAALITDAGRTTIEPGTVTCLCIGPDDDEKIDNITKDLKLL